MFSRICICPKSYFVKCMRSPRRCQTTLAPGVSLALANSPNGGTVLLAAAAVDAKVVMYEDDQNARDRTAATSIDTKIYLARGNVLAMSSDDDVLFVVGDVPGEGAVAAECSRLGAATSPGAAASPGAVAAANKPTGNARGATSSASSPAAAAAASASKRNRLAMSYCRPALLSLADKHYLDSALGLGAPAKRGRSRESSLLMRCLR